MPCPGRTRARPWATWLAQHLPEAALLSLQQDGITVPQAAWDVVRRTQSSGIAGLFTPTETTGGPTAVTPQV